MSSSEPTPLSDAEGTRLERSFDTTMPSDYSADGMSPDARVLARHDAGQSVAQAPLATHAPTTDTRWSDEGIDAEALSRWLNPVLGAPLSHDAVAASRRVESLRADVQQLLTRHIDQARRFEPLVPSAITHEAWMRLSDPARAAWGRRSAFLAVAAVLLRREVVTHTYSLRAHRADADASVMISGLEQLAGTVDRDVVAVHEALFDFAATDGRAARVVELRFFGGLENHEIAEALGLSLATVKRDWTTARHWLQRELAEA